MDKNPVATLIIGGIIRTLLASLGGWLAAKGIAMDQSLVEGLVGLAVVCIIALWSSINKTKLLSWMHAASRLKPGTPIDIIQAEAKEIAPVAAAIPL